MKRVIKFDLPIDGVKVTTLDELCDHFTTEILDHFHSGVLAKWLRSRDLEKESHEVEHLAKHSSKDDASTLKALCRIFSVEADDAVIEAAVGEKTETRTGLLLSEPLFSKEFFSWWIWLIYVLVDLEIVEKYSSTDFPKIRMLEQAHMHETLSKQDWDKYLRRRIVLWSVVAQFLRQCPAKSLSSEFVEQVESNISDCISCYRLSKDDHDLVLNALLTALSHDRYMPYPVNYHFFSQIFNAHYMYEDSTMLGHAFGAVAAEGNRTKTLTFEDIKERDRENMKLRRASNLLNKAFSQVRKSEFVNAVEKLGFLDLNLMVR